MAGPGLFAAHLRGPRHGGVPTATASHHVSLDHTLQLRHRPSPAAAGSMTRLDRPLRREVQVGDVLQASVQAGAR